MTALLDLLLPATITLGGVIRRCVIIAVIVCMPAMIAEIAEIDLPTTETTDLPSYTAPVVRYTDEAPAYVIVDMDTFTINDVRY